MLRKHPGVHPAPLPGCSSVHRIKDTLPGALSRLPVSRDATRGAHLSGVLITPVKTPSCPQAILSAADVNFFLAQLNELLHDTQTSERCFLVLSRVTQPTVKQLNRDRLPNARYSTSRMSTAPATRRGDCHRTETRAAAYGTACRGSPWSPACTRATWAPCRRQSPPAADGVARGASAAVGSA